MASDIYLQIEGIPGDSTDSKHAKWIEVLSFSLGVVQATGGAASAQGAHAGGRADFSDFSMMKKLDSSSPLLFLYCCNAKHIPNITLELCRAMGEKTCYMKFVFKDSIVSSYQPSGSSGGGDEIPIESLSFRFGEIHCIYTPTDPKSGGKTGADVKKGWSTLENKEVAPG